MNNKKARALRRIAHQQSRTEALTAPLGSKPDRAWIERRSYQAMKGWYKSLSVTEKMKIGKHAEKKQQGSTLQAQRIQEHKKG